MFTATFIYLASTFLIFWAYCGYFITLYLFSLFGDGKGTDKNGRDPSARISLIIPCYNEDNLIGGKIENIKTLAYPSDLLKIYFVDGSSTDKTVERLREEIKGLNNVEVVETGCRGKINQINFILPRLESDIVINSDMDTVLESDVILKLVRVFEDDPEAAVVGAHVIPKSNYTLETQYWQDQNLIRFLESSIHSASIVIAPCYAFRRALLKSFPEDCIADDIYISFLANVKGYKSKYIEDAVTYETRVPSNLQEVLRHKFRKGNAYIIELLRFLYMLPLMRPMWKVIYLTKFLQVIIIPWIIPFFLLSSISLILTGPEYVKLPAFAFTFLFLSLLSTRCLFSRGRKAMTDTRNKNRSSLALFLIANFILLINGLTFPFYRQTSSYSKINTKSDISAR